MPRYWMLIMVCVARLKCAKHAVYIKSKFEELPRHVMLLRSPGSGYLEYQGQGWALLPFLKFWVVRKQWIQEQQECPAAQLGLAGSGSHC